MSDCCEMSCSKKKKKNVTKYVYCYHRMRMYLDPELTLEAT